MQVNVASRWLPAQVERGVEGLFSQLQGFHGHRTVWLDEQGGLWHAEPDEMLEEFGHRYVGTFLRPGREELLEAVARAMPVRHRMLVEQPVPAMGLELAASPA